MQYMTKVEVKMVKIVLQIRNYTDKNIGRIPGFFILRCFNVSKVELSILNMKDFKHSNE